MQQFPALWCISADSPVQDTVDSVIAALSTWGHGPPGGRKVLVWDGRVDVGVEEGEYYSNAGFILLGPGPVLYPFPCPVALHLIDPIAAALWTAVVAVSQGYVVAGQVAGASMLRYRTPTEGEPEIALTSRELEVLELIAQGLPNKAVAHELGIGLGTVKFHLANLMGKLGVQNRAEAVMEAAREGVLKV